MEHRWGERLSVRTRVAIRARGGQQGIGYLRDVSVSGALLVSGMDAGPMSFVQVLLPASAAVGRKSIEGQVVRHTEQGFAVEWCELAPELMRSLARADHAHSDPPLQRSSEGRERQSEHAHARLRN